MVQYDDLMTAIIRKQITIMGAEKALKYARQVPGIVVADDGRVTSEADQTALAGLVQEYKKVAGTVAILLMKTAIAPLLKGADLTLPQELRWKK